jgi:hypothetical protein
LNMIESRDTNLLLEALAGEIETVADRVLDAGCSIAHIDALDRVAALLDRLMTLHPVAA